jgi:hypothetical protein
VSIPRRCAVLKRSASLRHGKGPPWLVVARLHLAPGRRDLCVGGRPIDAGVIGLADHKYGDCCLPSPLRRPAGAPSARALDGARPAASSSYMADQLEDGA